MKNQVAFFDTLRVDNLNVFATFAPKKSMTLHEKFGRYLKTVDLIYALENQISSSEKPLRSRLIHFAGTQTINLNNQVLNQDIEELRKKLSEMKAASKHLQTEMFTILKDLHLNTVKLQVDDYLYLVAPADRYCLNSSTRKILKKSGRISYRIIV